MSGVATLGIGREPPAHWPEHNALEVERDYRFWRHIRVAQARTMRHVHRAVSALTLGLCQSAFTSAYGVRMHADWSDRSYAYCHYGTYGCYLADIIRSIDCPFVFVDIGANQGVFSLIAANQPMCKQVLAIEPVAATHDQLLRNIALNRLQDRIVPFEFAVSDRFGVSTMRRLKVHSGVATLEPHFATGDPGSISQPVSVKRIEELYRHLPEGLPVFVKINVAGHELTVLDQVVQSHFADRLIGVFCNQDDRWCKPAQFEAALKRAGFTGLGKYKRHRGSDFFVIPQSRITKLAFGVRGEHSDVFKRGNLFPLAI